MFFFSSRRRHTRFSRDWSSDVCSSDLEIDELIDAYRQIPEMAQTEVSAPGAKESEKKVRDYNFEISKVPDSKNTKITVDTGEAMERARDLANYLRNAFNFAMSPLAAVATIGRQYRRWGGIDYHM